MSSSPSATRQKKARFLRKCRAIHRTSGITLMAFILAIACTGLLLGWKKNTNGYLLAPTRNGSSTDFRQWLPIDSLHSLACTAFADSMAMDQQPVAERIDIRKEKGIVKFSFAGHYSGIQMDGATGKILAWEVRRADLIEDLHDGSFFDSCFNTSGEIIKLIYTSVMGSALLLFSLTGFWLWYGPRRM